MPSIASQGFSSFGFDDLRSSGVRLQTDTVEVRLNPSPPSFRVGATLSGGVAEPISQKTNKPIFFIGLAARQRPPESGTNALARSLYSPYERPRLQQQVQEEYT